MKFSLNWLKDYVDISQTPENLAELLVMHSFEVEGIEKNGDGLDRIVIGKVLKVDKLPKSDKLSICKVDVGQKKILQIVCGAANITEGQKVPVALIGAVLPDGLKIEKRELMGAVSEGMICSAEELGLAVESAGILELDSKLKTGALVKDVLGLSDVMLDIDILPNRAHDCLSYLGMAKEIGVLINKKVKNPLENISIQKDKSFSTKDVVDVAVKASLECCRYMAQAIKGVKVADSPLWLQQRLQSAGMKSINNVVDITNFVMLETGQPLHAFDGSFLQKEISVRKSKKGEAIIALDGKNYELAENDLVISSGGKTIALAGIIGGESLSVKNETSLIVLESANFDYKTIRQTSRRLNIATDSSDRFSKEIDANLAEDAMKRAISLILEICGGSAAKNWIDIYPKKTVSKKISVSVAEIQKISGADIKESEIVSILKRGDYKFKKLKGCFDVEIPTIRKDLSIMQDMAEEIIRIYGYSNIKPQMPKEEIGFAGKNKKLDLEYSLKDVLRGIGFAEMYNYSFIEKSLLGNELLEIANPMQKNCNFMRDSLVNNILKNISHNLKFYSQFRIYELGKVFHKTTKGLPVEENMLCGAVVLEKDKKGETFFAAKGILELLNSVLKLGMQFQISDAAIYHPRRFMSIKMAEKHIGSFGEIHPNILKEFDIDKRVAIFDLNFDMIASLVDEKICYQSIVKFPKIELDLSVIVEKKILWENIKDAILKVSKDLVKEVKLFDYYESKEIGEGKKSLAFRIVYQAENRTLAGKEAQDVQDQIIAKLKKLGAEIRR